MNSEIYATMITGLSIIIIALIVMMYTVAKMNQQATNQRIDDLRQETNRQIDDLKRETNRRIDELRQNTLEQFAGLRQDLLGVVGSKSKELFKNAA